MDKTADPKAKYKGLQRDQGFSDLIVRMAINLLTNLVIRRIRKKHADKRKRHRAEKKVARTGRRGGAATEDISGKAQPDKRRIIGGKPSGKPQGKKEKRAKRFLWIVPFVILLVAGSRLRRK